MVALAGAGLLLLSRRLHSRDMLGLVDWQLLVLFMGLFVVNHALQATGLPEALVQAAMEPFAHVRQQVLLTDDEPRQRSFYESLGYAEIRDHGDGRLRAFVRFLDPSPAAED